MTWLSWRQFRGQALVAAAGLTAVAIALLVTGPGLAHYYSTMVETCQSRGDCDVVASVLGEKHELLQLLSTVLVIVPALVGMFWGAPLVARELETGTYRLVWTQSVTRSRWLALRVAVVGLGSIVVAGLLSLMVTWWSSPLDTTRQYRFRPDIFSERGIVAVGYAAFAFALGLTAGLLIRKTLPAMATALFGFIALRLIVQDWVRPRLLPPSELTLPLDEVQVGLVRNLDGDVLELRPDRVDLPNAWVHSTSVVDATGNEITGDAIAAACPAFAQATPANGGDGGGTVTTQGPPGSRDAFTECITKLGETYHTLVSFQPAKQFWTFQAMETAIFLGLAVGLIGFSFWWLRRRLR